MNDDLTQSKKGVNADWIKRAADSKIDRQSALLLDKKSVHKMVRDTANEDSKKGEFYSRKTAGTRVLKINKLWNWVLFHDVIVPTCHLI